MLVNTLHRGKGVHQGAARGIAAERIIGVLTSVHKFDVQVTVHRDKFL